MNKKRGSCVCGVTGYEFDGEPFDCCYCHCRICRKLTGSAAGTYGSVKRARFKWLGETEQLRTYSPTANSVRYFCSVCGSFLLSEHSLEPENVFVSLGTLDDSIDSKPEYHQFADEMSDWNNTEHDLPKHPKWPPD